MKAANNLGTVNDFTGLSLAGITVGSGTSGNPSGPVTVGGNAFTLGSGGLALSAATAATPLTINLGSLLSE